jgi:hypothetical protein
MVTTVIATVTATVTATVVAASLAAVTLAAFTGAGFKPTAAFFTTSDAATAVAVTSAV